MLPRQESGISQNTSMTSQALDTVVEPKRMPKLVLGLIHGDLSRDLANYFASQGWRVCTADTSREVRQVAFNKSATAVVLPVKASRGESGFLTCAKLKATRPQTRVVLVGPANPALEQFALFAGATGYVTENMGHEAIRDLILGQNPLPV